MDIFEGSGWNFDWGSVGDWMSQNPGLTGAGIGALLTLADPAKPTTTTQQQSVSLPDYAAPFVGRMLNRAESLAGEDYIPYTGARLADFTPDQQAAFERIRSMPQTDPMIGQGGGIVGEAANQLLQRGNQRWDQAAADHYMSPYMQSVVDIQKREADRDFGKQLLDINSRAAKSSAFGGSRHALVESEARRDLSQRLGDLQAQGLQSAFTNAQGQFNADMSRQGGMLGSAVGAGSTLAGIGQQNNNTQLANNAALLGIGSQQQGLEQRGLDIGYQNFQDQRNHPYNQLRFQQGFLSGLPMTQYATANTSPAPTLGQQLIGSGIGGYMIGRGG